METIDENGTKEGEGMNENVIILCVRIEIGEMKEIPKVRGCKCEYVCVCKQSAQCFKKIQRTFVQIQILFYFCDVIANQGSRVSVCEANEFVREARRKRKGCLIGHLNIYCDCDVVLSTAQHTFESHAHAIQLGVCLYTHISH